MSTDGSCIEVVSEVSEVKDRLPDKDRYRSGLYCQADIDACLCEEADERVFAMLARHDEDMEAHSILNGF